MSDSVLDVDGRANASVVGPSASEDVSDVVTGRRKRQHIDYKVTKCTQAAATCLQCSTLTLCHPVTAPASLRVQ